MEHIVSLCDYSGVMVAPWAKAGYTCHIVDIKHPNSITKIRNLYKYGMTIKEFSQTFMEIPYIIFAFPPCTHLAVSGARWFKNKGLRKLAESINIFADCQEFINQYECPWFIENPVSTISTYWRKPDFKFDPCDFGGYVNGKNAYTKKTCLWTGNSFNMPPPKRIKPIEGSKMHLLPPSKDRAELRSITPEGFAKAVYLFNKDE